MRILLAASLTLALFSPAEPSARAFEVAATPTGCMVTLGGSSEDFRLDSLANGGVLVTLHDAVLPPGESRVADGCIASYRVSPASSGTGSLIEIEPAGVEFGGVVRT